MISGNAFIAGVMGWPVSHSLSPKLHDRWLAECGIDGAYIPLPVAPDDLELVFRALPRLGFRGWNLTVPHKEAALSLVDEADETARAIGAVNTVIVREDFSLFGTNTDAKGFLANLAPHSPDYTRCVVIGAGGAARAVAYALRSSGAKETIIVNRTLEKAQALGRAVPWEQRAQALEGATLLVNTTTQGMRGHEPLDLPLHALPKAALVTDIVYAPLMTPLLEAARARGNPVATGIGMLVHQAAPGFAAWFGRQPNITQELASWLLDERNED